MSGKIRRARDDRRTPALRRTAQCGQRRTDDGAAAVEFALVVPFLILLTFGLIQYGFYFWAKQGGSDIARTAARMAAVGAPASCVDFRSDVVGLIDGFGAAQGAGTITRTYRNGPGNTDESLVEVGDVVTISVTFESIDLGMPIIPFVDGGRVSETVESRVEFVPAAPEVCA